MNRGCLVLAGLGLVSLFAFGVTLEAINDPEQLTAIPFSPWDFVTYGLMALAMIALIRLVRRPDQRKRLARTWTSRFAQQGARLKTNLGLARDGSVVIDTTVSNRAGSRKLSTQARWQLLENKTLHIWGSQTVTWKLLRLNSWRMITADQAGAGLPVRWTAFPRVNLKLWLLIAPAVLVPVFMVLSLPRSQPSHAIADDPQYVPASTPHHTHRLSP